MRLASLLILCSVAAFGAPKIIFEKSFPGSVPAYFSVHLDQDGAAVYREAVDEEEPVNFRLPEKDVKQIFELAGRLEYFKRPLESNLKVANMGQKTFRWENGSEKREVKFNYSLDTDAKALLDWFERMSETQQLHYGLERTVRYDRLGVMKSLLQLESSWDRDRLVAADRFLPLLDRVAKNEVYLHMARERAASLAEAFRAGKPVVAEAQGQAQSK